MRPPCRQTMDIEFSDDSILLSPWLFDCPHPGGLCLDGRGKKNPTFLISTHPAAMVQRQGRRMRYGYRKMIINICDPPPLQTQVLTSRPATVRARASGPCPPRQDTNRKVLGRSPSNSFLDNPKLQLYIVFPLAPFREWMLYHSSTYLQCAPPIESSYPQSYMVVASGAI